jgi:hypothetical protein
VGLQNGELLLMNRKPTAAELAAGWCPTPHQPRAKDLKAGPSPISVLSPDCDFEFSMHQHVLAGVDVLAIGSG